MYHTLLHAAQDHPADDHAVNEHLTIFTEARAAKIGVPFETTITLADAFMTGIHPHHTHLYFDSNYDSYKIILRAFAGLINSRPDLVAVIDFWNEEKIPDNFGEHFKTFTNIHIYGENLKTIGFHFFSDFTRLTHLRLPDGITTIGDHFLHSCTNLRDLMMPEKITTLGKGSFGGCLNLTHLTLAQSTTTIDEYFLAQCQGLTHLTLRGHITTIGNRFLHGCRGLQEGSVGVADLDAFRELLHTSACEKNQALADSTIFYQLDTGYLLK